MPAFQTKIKFINEKSGGNQILEKNSNDGYSRCWIHFGCQNDMKSKCDAFSEDKVECWLINSLEPEPRIKDNGDCFNCDWFKKHNNRESTK